MIPLAAAAIVVLPVNIAGSEPAAIVEDVALAVGGVRPMDVLEVGQKFTLPKGAHLTLGYFRSCLREEITGGNVTIGKEKSNVIDGKLDGEAVDCEGEPQITTRIRSAEAAAAVFRKGQSKRKTFPKPDWTLYGTSPVLRFSKPQKNAQFRRLDRPDEKPIDLDVKGSSIDTAKLGVMLDPGGLYALSTGGKQYILKISPLAIPDAPLLSRLIPM